MRKLLTATLAFGALALASCEQPSHIAERNISTAANNFEVVRRIVFFNGITDTYLLEITGLCAFGDRDTERQRTVTCRTGPNEYKRHFLGLSDNVTYFAEQVEGIDVSTFHHRVVFRPQAILPDIDIQTSAEELSRDRH